jgi:hypothetical protein
MFKQWAALLEGLCCGLRQTARAGKAGDLICVTTLLDPPHVTSGLFVPKLLHKKNIGKCADTEVLARANFYAWHHLL